MNLSHPCLRECKTPYKTSCFRPLLNQAKKSLKKEIYNSISYPRFMEVISLKETDYHILRHLRQNARQNLTDISRRTHIPVSTLFDRVDRKSTRLNSSHMSISYAV